MLALAVCADSSFFFLGFFAGQDDGEGGRDGSSGMGSSSRSSCHNGLVRIYLDSASSFFSSSFSFSSESA